MASFAVAAMGSALPGLTMSGSPEVWLSNSRIFTLRQFSGRPSRYIPIPSSSFTRPPSISFMTPTAANDFVTDAT